MIQNMLELGVIVYRARSNMIPRLAVTLMVGLTSKVILVGVMRISLGATARLDLGLAGTQNGEVLRFFLMLGTLLQQPVVRVVAGMAHVKLPKEQLAWTDGVLPHFASRHSYTESRRFRDVRPSTAKEGVGARMMTHT